jgi:hypothetical protein
LAVGGWQLAEGAKELGARGNSVLSYSSTLPSIRVESSPARATIDFRSGCMPLWPAFLTCSQRGGCLVPGIIGLLEKHCRAQAGPSKPKHAQVGPINAAEALGGDLSLFRAWGRVAESGREIRLRCLFGADSHLSLAWLSPNSVFAFAQGPSFASPTSYPLRRRVSLGGPASGRATTCMLCPVFGTNDKRVVTMERS